ncbi:MAG TPA: AAA family ATPase [Allocoleopsis sp.]
MNKKTTGLVLGKFMPFHKGHELLIQFANNFVDQLYVVLDPIKNESIPMRKRGEWIKKTIPEVEVLYLTKYHPQEPQEHPDFWQIWQYSLLSLLPEKPDYVFASESYGFKLAEVLDAKFIPVDLKRENVPISATKIKANLYDNWHYLCDVVKLDFLMRICVFGPESTGKTTLCQQLATYYHTVYVPEYARFLIETKGNINKQDMIDIARGQIALERAIAPKANRILFCDTDPLTTTIWSNWLFNDCPEEIFFLAKEKKYELYLLTDIDLEWQSDNVRYFPEKRKEFLADCIDCLESNNRKYSIISGKGEERIKNAINVISMQVNEYFNYFQKY